MSPAPWTGIPIVTTTVVASPALAAETIVASLTVGSVADPTTQIQLAGWAAYTVGAAGAAVTFRIRRNGLTGTLVAASGALTRAAASLQADDLNGADAPGEVASLTYVLTMQVTGATGASAVSAVYLSATPAG